MPFVKTRRVNAKYDENFVKWMREQRKQFKEQTGITIPSDLKFSAMLVNGNLLKVRFPKKRGGFDVKFIK